MVSPSRASTSASKPPSFSFLQRAKRHRSDSPVWSHAESSIVHGAKTILFVHCIVTEAQRKDFSETPDQILLPSTRFSFVYFHRLDSIYFSIFICLLSVDRAQETTESIHIEKNPKSKNGKENLKIFLCFTVIDSLLWNDQKLRWFLVWIVVFAVCAFQFPFVSHSGAASHMYMHFPEDAVPHFPWAKNWVVTFILLLIWLRISFQVYIITATSTVTS